MDRNKIISELIRTYDSDKVVYKSDHRYKFKYSIEVNGHNITGDIVYFVEIVLGRMEKNNYVFYSIAVDERLNKIYISLLKCTTDYEERLFFHKHRELGNIIAFIEKNLFHSTWKISHGRGGIMSTDSGELPIIKTTICKGSFIPKIVKTHTPVEIKDMYRDNILTDVRIISTDENSSGEEIMAHKIIIAHYSEVFMAKFTSEFDSDTIVVEYPIAIAKAVIDLIYYRLSYILEYHDTTFVVHMYQFAHCYFPSMIDYITNELVCRDDFSYLPELLELYDNDHLQKFMDAVYLDII